MRHCVVILATLAVVFASGLSFAEEAPQIPKDIQETLQSFVGKWSIESTEGDVSSTATLSVRMAPGNHCVTGTFAFRKDGERVWASIVTGWDSSTGGITEQALRSDGMVSTIRLTKAADNSWEGERAATLNGKPLTAKMRFEIKGPTEMATELTERKLGDESLPDRTIRFTRVVREKKPKRERKE